MVPRYAPSTSTSACSHSMYSRKAKSLPCLARDIRQFSSTAHSHRKHTDHYATLAVPRTATKAQIKTSYYQLSKKYHPDVAKDHASQARFHAVSEAYAILGDDRKRREYDRSLGSPLHASHASGQHPQATTTRPSHQPGFRHPWPSHPRNRTRGMGGHPPTARYDFLYEHARANNHMHHHPPSGSQTPHTTASRADPFSNPHVQRATGYRRSESGAASQSSSSRPNPQPGGFQGAGSTPWAAPNGERRRSSVDDGRPTRDEAAAANGMMRALGASGLIGVIMLVATLGGASKQTS